MALAVDHMVDGTFTGTPDEIAAYGAAVM